MSAWKEERFPCTQCPPIVAVEALYIRNRNTVSPGNPAQRAPPAGPEHQPLEIRDKENLSWSGTVDKHQSTAAGNAIYGNAQPGSDRIQGFPGFEPVFR